MIITVTLELQTKDGDEDLTTVTRMRLAKEAISQLLLQIKEKLNTSDWELHLIAQSQSSRCMRLAMGDEDWEGTDLAKAKREVSKKSNMGSKVRP